jgi:gamma-glutamylcysteine synthetase
MNYFVYIYIFNIYHTRYNSITRRIGTEHEKFGYQLENLRPIEYEAHVNRAISAASDAQTFYAWWGSAEERKLRGICGIVGEHMEAIKANVGERYRELRKGAA